MEQSKPYGKAARTDMPAWMPAAMVGGVVAVAFAIFIASTVVSAAVKNARLRFQRLYTARAIQNVQDPAAADAFRQDLEACLTKQMGTEIELVQRPLDKPEAAECEKIPAAAIFQDPSGETLDAFSALLDQCKNSNVVGSALYEIRGTGLSLLALPLPVGPYGSPAQAAVLLSDKKDNSLDTAAFRGAADEQVRRLGASARMCTRQVLDRRAARAATRYIRATNRAHAPH